MTVFCIFCRQARNCPNLYSRFNGGSEIGVCVCKRRSKKICRSSQPSFYFSSRSLALSTFIHRETNSFPYPYFVPNRFGYFKLIHHPPCIPSLHHPSSNIFHPSHFVYITAERWASHFFPHLQLLSVLRSWVVLGSGSWLAASSRSNGKEVAY